MTRTGSSDHSSNFAQTDKPDWPQWQGPHALMAVGAALAPGVWCPASSRFTKRQRSWLGTSTTTGRKAPQGPNARSARELICPRIANLPRRSQKILPPEGHIFAQANVCPRRGKYLSPGANFPSEGKSILWKTERSNPGRKAPWGRHRSRRPSGAVSQSRFDYSSTSSRLFSAHSGN